MTTVNASQRTANTTSTTTATSTSTPSRTPQVDADADAITLSSAPTTPDVQRAAHEEFRRALLATGTVVDKEDRVRLRSALAKLSPDDARVALSMLAREGKLADVGGTGPDATAFMRILVAKGMAKDAGAQPAESNNGVLTPPAAPHMFALDESLLGSRALRDITNSANTASASEYKRGYLAYQDDYLRAIDNAKSPADIRRLGKPAEYSNLARAFFREVDPPSSTRIYDALDKLTATANGERRAGEVYAFAEAEKGVGGGLGGHGGGAHARVSLGYRVETSAKHGEAYNKVGGAVNVGPTSLGASGEYPIHDGHASDEPESGELEFEIGEKKELIEHAAAAEGGAGVRVTSDHRLELFVSAKLAAHLPLEAIVVDATGRLGLGVQLSNPDEMARALENDGFFADLPKLVPVPWGQLEPGDKALAQSMGWSKEEWNARLPIRICPVPR